MSDAKLLRIVILTCTYGLFAVSLTAQDRLPPLSPDKMTDAQKKAAAEYKALRGSEMTTPPWTVLSRVPDYVIPVLQMRLHNQNNSALSPKLTEFAILIAARHWTNNFEWELHREAAIKAGLSQDIMAAVADGRRPERMAEDEELPGTHAQRKRQRSHVSAGAGSLWRGGHRRGDDS